MSTTKRKSVPIPRSDVDGVTTSRNLTVLEERRLPEHAHLRSLLDQEAALRRAIMAERLRLKR